MLNERVPTKFEMTFSKSVISAPLPRFPEAQLSSAMDGDFINAGASLEWQLRAHGVSHSALHHSFHPLSCEPCNKCICLPVAVEWNRHRLRLPVANNLQCNRKQLNLHITHDHRQFADSALASTSLIGSLCHFMHSCYTNSGAFGCGRGGARIRTSTVARQGLATGCLMAP